MRGGKENEQKGQREKKDRVWGGGGGGERGSNIAILCLFFYKHFRISRPIYHIHTFTLTSFSSACLMAGWPSYSGYTRSPQLLPEVPILTYLLVTYQTPNLTRPDLTYSLPDI